MCHMWDCLPYKKGSVYVCKKTTVPHKLLKRWVPHNVRVCVTTSAAGICDRKLQIHVDLSLITQQLKLTISYMHNAAELVVCMCRVLRVRKTKKRRLRDTNKTRDIQSWVCVC